MTLSSQGQYLIYSWLSIAEPERQFTASFGNVLANITRRKDPYLIVATKKYYDEYVRDILIEDRLTYKTKRVIVKNGSNHPKIGIIAYIYNKRNIVVNKCLYEVYFLCLITHCYYTLKNFR